MKQENNSSQQNADESQNPSPDSDRSADQPSHSVPIELAKRKKPYEKPEVIRYGTVNDLTASGQPGSFMDAQFPGGGTKTGF